MAKTKSKKTVAAPAAPNFLRDYEAAMSRYTDAPVIFHRAVASGILGSLLTTHRNRCHLYGGIELRWPNLWVVLVGTSADARKTTCVGMGDAVLSRTIEGKNLRGPDDGSPEGFARDLLRRENAQTGNAASVLVAGELMSFLSSLNKDYMRGAKYMFMDWHDSPRQFARTLSKEEYRIPNPRMSLIGGIATELLPNVTDSGDWLGGLMNRCLLVHGTEKSHVLRESRTPPPELYQQLAEQLDRLVKRWRIARRARQAASGSKNPVLFDFNEEALALKQKLEDAYPKAVGGENDSFFGRSNLHLNKLCAIEQIALNPESDCITAEAVDAAAVLWRHWRETAGNLKEMCFARSNFDLEGDKLPRRMMRRLQDAGEKGMSERELMRATVLNHDLFTKGLMTLEMAGMARREADETTGEVVIRMIT